jgi:hypothetical protein
MHSNDLKLLISLFLITKFAVAQKSFSDSYKPGDKLYVYTHDGLSLREQADAKGKLIEVVAYGEEVVVLADSQPRALFTSSNIPGAWVKVKCHDKLGYMFNGFLSKLRPIKNSAVERFREDVYNYLKQEFKSIKETKTPPEPIYRDYLKVELGNGATYETKDYEGGSTITITLPINTITYQEVFLFARLAYPEFFVNKKCDYKLDNTECEMDDLTSLSIKKEGNFYSIMYGAAD